MRDEPARVAQAPLQPSHAGSNQMCLHTMRWAAILPARLLPSGEVVSIISTQVQGRDMSLIFRNADRFRRVMNLFPPYLGTGISVTDVAPDFRSMTVVMRQRWYNRNAFGTHFGGSLYSMCDPHYVLLLIPLLGPEYIIWDKAAGIEFLKPARGTVKAVFDWNDDQLQEIRARTISGEKYEPLRILEITDDTGTAVARVSKTLYVRRKKPKTKAP